MPRKRKRDRKKSGFDLMLSATVPADLKGFTVINDNGSMSHVDLNDPLADVRHLIYNLKLQY